VSDAPLDPEPVLGWRAWRLERRNGRLCLVSLTRPDAWPPMDALQARCDRGQHASTPAAACSCGIYATREPEDLPRAGITGYGVAVVGAIAMWGRVVEHTSGARSEKAYPVRLRLVCGDCLVTGRGAIEPAQVFSHGTRLTAACASHARGSSGGVDARAVQWELLSTYAVDLLPIERVADALKLPPRPKSSPGRTVLEAIATGIMLLISLAINVLGFLWVAGTILAVAGFAFGVVTHVLGIGQPADAALSPGIVRAAGHVLVDYPDVDPPMRVVCGRGVGGVIVFADCASANDDVVGVATQAPGSGPTVDCLGDWVAYSYGGDHRVCWHPTEGEDP
jgi:hypothetical protein